MLWPYVSSFWGGLNEPSAPGGCRDIVVDARGGFAVTVGGPMLWGGCPILDGI